MYRKLIVAIVLVFFYSKVHLAQVILEKEVINKNKYKLFCKVDLNNLEIETKNGRNVLLYKGYYDPTKPGEIALPNYDVFVAIPYGSNPSVSLTEQETINYEANPNINPKVFVVDSQFVYSDEAILKPKPSEKLIERKGFLWMGDSYCIHLNLKLFKIKTGSFGTSLIQRFIIELSFGSDIEKLISNSEFNSDPSILNNKLVKNSITDSQRIELDTDSWINYNQQYVKVGVNKDGIFRIKQEDLISAGVDVYNINPNTIQVFLKGDEIPVFIAGENDRKFDLTDYIEFIGNKNINNDYREISEPGTPYKEYLNRYTDTTYYWITWGGNEGKRVNIKNTYGGLATDTLKYYSDVIHIENNNWFDFSMQDAVLREMPAWSENKTWNEGNLNVGTKNVSFTLKDIYQNKPFKVFAKLQDYASSILTNAHLLAISINNSSKQDSGYINRYQQKVLQGIYNSNLLKTGVNTLSIHSLPTAANPNLCIMDWYEVEYPRYLKLINDSLNFQFPYLTNTAFKAINITGLISSKKYLLWKNGKDFVKYIIKAGNLNALLTDSVGNKDRFYIIDSTKVMRPKVYTMKNFVNLRDKLNSADYISITHNSFLKNVSDYNDFIKKNYGVRTFLVNVDDIYDEFAFGFLKPEAIKDFLYTAKNKWLKPSPKYVFLIGGATYDYLGNKNKYQGAPKVVNYVPSYGAPVSDNWFVAWDSTDTFIPQMNIGRIPVTSNEELIWYFNKHKEYISQKNSSWNKRYIFFSGGTGNDQNQLDQLRNTNNYIINNFVTPPPVGGNYTHFYKTTNPVSNFGAYTPSEFQNIVDSGSVFISYLGHSGTQTWDNSITDPSQLKSKNNHYPLITDFGCSTAKFAEPDVVSFSQLFVNKLQGHAIGYIGNSSLGFTSTSYSFPQLFYKKILIDTIHTIGEAHRLAKLELVKNYGLSGAVKLFLLTNSLIGDPIVRLSIPNKPDLSITQNEIVYSSKSITDNLDSIGVTIKFFNYGLVRPDTFSVSVKDYYNKSVFYSKLIRKQLPSFQDSIKVFLPIKNKPGEHVLYVSLDINNKLSELSKNNNTIELTYNVASSAIKLINNYEVEGQLSNPISFINPVVKPISNTVRLDVSSDSEFKNFISLELGFNLAKTSVHIPTQFNQRRVWLRSRLNNATDYSSTSSFKLGDNNGYNLYDGVSFSKIEKHNLTLGQQGLNLDEKLVTIKSLSAGYNDGNTALIQLNNQNLIPENTLGGHHIVVLDSNYKALEYKRFFILGDASSTQNYINFLDTLSQKRFVIFAVSDEGSVSSTDLKSKIKLFGSKYIDSLSFRGSWVMIGKKGAKTGAVPEKYSKAFKGRVQIDTVITSRYDTGKFITTKIGPAEFWREIIIKDSIPTGSSINYRLLKYKNDNTMDTSYYLQPQNSSIDIKNIDAKIYRHIKLLGEIRGNSKFESPVFKGLQVKYSNVPELGTNYQVVSISKDSLDQGEKTNLNFSVYNVGESTASNFKVRVDLVKKDNSKEKLFEQVVDSVQTEKKKDFGLTYTTDKLTGSNQFQITIDAENTVTELYKDNNFYSVPFYVKPNNKPASLKLTIDGNDILNGDFISSKPNFRVELSDESLIPITDTSKVLLYLNNKRIYYSSNTGILTYNYSSSNPKMVVNYTPTLSDGNYTLKVVGKNATDQIIDSTGIVRKFTVKNELQLLNAYNYPNPFKDDTYFTFKLTQLPDELKIIIYTIAGRNIKEIKLNSSELRFDFNRIPWDGRDDDGDLAANGVYLYKVISKKGSEKTEVIQKLSILR